MTENLHIGSDALAFLESIIPDTPEMQRVEKQERFRIALTQAMRELRNQVGVTQKELAQRLGIGQSWVSKLESANNDHTFESILAYLDALGAELKASILLDGQEVLTICTDSNLTGEVNTSSINSRELCEDSETHQETQSIDFPLLSPERKIKCERAKTALTKARSLWSTAA
jgi:transcriptional regulator with XRE-family HTH domain